MLPQYQMGTGSTSVQSILKDTDASVFGLGGFMALGASHIIDLCYQQTTIDEALPSTAEPVDKLFF